MNQAARLPYIRVLSTGRTRTVLLILSVLAASLLAVLPYWRALGFALFNDDPSGHFRWLAGRSLGELFLSSAGYGYYRPLSFAIWKILAQLFGGYSAPGLHAFSLLLHAIDAGLLWVVALMLSRKYLVAWFTALIFIFFPLNYEAVAYVASMFHPLLVCFALLAILLYHLAIDRGKRSYLAAALVTSALALFIHENGTIIPLLLLLWEVVVRPPHSLRDLLARPVRWFFVAPLLFLLFWLSIPKTGTSHLQSPADIITNIYPFLQMLAYPVLPLLHLSSASTGILVALVLVLVVLFYLLARFAQAGRIWFFATGWVLLAALPSVLVLDPPYLYGGPRLFYFASIGTAIFWSIPVLALLRLGQNSASLRSLAYITTLGLILGVALPSLSYVNCSMAFYVQTSHIVRLLRDNAAEAPAGRGLVYLNLPFYIGSIPENPNGCGSNYPFTAQGAVIIPPYAHIADFIYFNGGPDRPAEGYSFAGYSPGWTTFGQQLSPDALHAALYDDQVYVFNLLSESFFDLNAIWHPVMPQSGQSPAVFGNLIALDKSTIAKTDTQITVKLFWRALGTPARPLTVFVHLYDQKGNRIAQHDGPPASNFAPAQFWQSGDVIEDTHILPISAPPQPGTYSLVVGIYDSTTTDRLPAHSADGKALDGNVFWLGDVEFK